jgi:hypothetical protein
VKTTTADFKTAAVVSLVLVLPLAALEVMNNGVAGRNAPGLLLLFGLLWLLPAAFITVLLPLARDVRAGRGGAANPAAFSLKVSFLALAAAAWVWGLADQLPCFLGVPNCD